MRAAPSLMIIALLAGAGTACRKGDQQMQA